MASVNDMWSEPWTHLQLDFTFKMPPKRQQAWNDLENKMKHKRIKANALQQRGKKAGSAPHELMSEPDNKQTFKPVQPREFVTYEYDDLTLANFKKACAAHFRLPASSCDVLVTNKGPLCTNINQIPHRKDKVRMKRTVYYYCIFAYKDTLCEF